MNSLLSYGDSDEESDSSKSNDTGLSAKVESKTKCSAASSGGRDDANCDEVRMDLSEDDDRSTENEDESTSDRKQNHRHSKNARNDSPPLRVHSKSSSSHGESSDRRRRRHDSDSDAEDHTRRRSSGYHSHYRDRRREKDDERSPDRRHRHKRKDDHYRSRHDDRRSSRRHSRSRSRSRDRHYRRRSPYEYGISTPVVKKGIPMPLANANSSEPATDGAKGGDLLDATISGRFREQIEKRKLLWQRKNAESVESSQNNSSPNNRTSQGEQAKCTAGSSDRTDTTGVWQQTRFSQDQDGRMVNKFKRLMGIKEAENGNLSTKSDGKTPGIDVMKKQQEMFTSMEQQYEVARTTTHTMRGMGLGFAQSFGSFTK